MLPPNMVRDHLRVCGADMGCRTLSPLRTGSPPRVRSRLTGSDTIRFDRGITSACAEQTTAPIPSPNLRWDHLRVCGADTVSLLSNLRDGGSPPRVRSRRHGGSDAARRIGITSACAEQTPACCSGKIIQWDHLRVCGADLANAADLVNPYGSPPRVRSRRRLDDLPVRRRRITSACAEQTGSTSGVESSTRDHLRVCGADYVIEEPDSIVCGSPPRVRSRPRRLPGRGVLRGITSACAEQTT